LFDLITIHQLIDSVISILDARDPYTYEHSERVAYFSERIAIKMNLDSRSIALIHFAAHLHDIGKVGVPDYVLNKQGKLTNEEYNLMKSHPRIGYNIVKNIEVIKEISPLILYHHERWDGNGYPEGLKGNDIPLGARIIALVDSFDAMTSTRTYKNKMTVDEAFDELQRVSGTQLSPEVVDCFFSMRDEVENMLSDVNKKMNHYVFNDTEKARFNRSQILPVV